MQWQMRRGALGVMEAIVEDVEATGGVMKATVEEVEATGGWWRLQP